MYFFFVLFCFVLFKGANLACLFGLLTVPPLCLFTLLCMVLYIFMIMEKKLIDSIDS